MFDCTDEGSGSFFAHSKYSYMEKGIVPADGYKDMSLPTKEFYKLLMEGRIIHFVLFLLVCDELGFPIVPGNLKRLSAVVKAESQNNGKER